MSASSTNSSATNSALQTQSPTTPAPQILNGSFRPEQADAFPPRSSANESACAVEESLFDSSRKPSPNFPCHRPAHFTFRFPRDSYPRLFPVARRNLCIPVDLIRLRIGASVVRTRRLPLWRFLVPSRLWRNFRFGTERFLNRLHHGASFSLQT
jgi:hypothetical protein